MEDLPAEVVRHLLRYIAYRELIVTASVVCTRWRHISYDLLRKNATDLWLALPSSPYTQRARIAIQPATRHQYTVRDGRESDDAVRSALARYSNSAAYATLYQWTGSTAVPEDDPTYDEMDFPYEQLVEFTLETQVPAISWIEEEEDEIENKEEDEDYSDYYFSGAGSISRMDAQNVQATRPWASVLERFNGHQKPVCLEKDFGVNGALFSLLRMIIDASVGSITCASDSAYGGHPFLTSDRVEKKLYFLIPARNAQWLLPVAVQCNEVPGVLLCVHVMDKLSP